MITELTKELSQVKRTITDLMGRVPTLQNRILHERDDWHTGQLKTELQDIRQAIKRESENEKLIESDTKRSTEERARSAAAASSSEPARFEMTPSTA